MKLMLILLSFLAISCSSEQSRKIASYSSDSYVLGNVNHSLSKVTLMAPEGPHIDSQSTFHVQLKNDNGTYVDCDKNDLLIKMKNGQKIPFDFVRLMPGNYYLTIKQNGKREIDTVDVYYKKRSIRRDIKLRLGLPDPANSKMSILSNFTNQLTVELTLKDQLKRPLDSSLEPEVVLDGFGEISGLERAAPGVWHFTVTYPDHNQVMYFSVRVHGMSLDRILRYQHIEK